MTENSAKRTGVVLAGDHRRCRTCGRCFRRCSRAVDPPVPPFGAVLQPVVAVRTHLGVQVQHRLMDPRRDRKSSWLRRLGRRGRRALGTHTCACPRNGIHPVNDLVAGVLPAVVDSGDRTQRHGSVGHRPSDTTLRRRQIVSHRLNSCDGSGELSEERGSVPSPPSG